jgi:hypothetical protein
MVLLESRFQNRPGQGWGIPSAEGKSVESSEMLKRICASFRKLGHALLLAIDHWGIPGFKERKIINAVKGGKVLLVVP